MRQLAPIGLAALAGLVLAVPTASQAGVPGACQTCGGKLFPQKSHVHQQNTSGFQHGDSCGCPNCQLARAQARAERDGATLVIEGTGPALTPSFHGSAFPTATSSQPTTSAYTATSGVVHGDSCGCPNCQLSRAMARAERDGATLVIEGPGPDQPPVGNGASFPIAHVHQGETTRCAACEAGANGAPVMVVGTGDEPGYASVGGEAAPGRASVGNPAMASNEPLPIGVVRAGFQNTSQEPTSFAPSMAPGAPSPMAGMPPTAGPVPTARTQRPGILSHVFGVPRFGRMARAREAQRREQHAKISYGPTGGRLNDLPASMVYGR